MADTAYVYADPLSCVPFSNIKYTTRAGILRLASLFNRASADELGSAAGGISFGSKTAVVVLLTGED